MADKLIHQLQAQHNEAIAQMLVDIKQPPCFDWGITVAFYAAVHYFECLLYNEPEVHTETSIPTGLNGKLSYSPHAWRENLIKSKLSKNAYKAYRKLKINSETARYLCINTWQSWIPTTSIQYFSQIDSQKLVYEVLSDFKSELTKP